MCLQKYAKEREFNRHKMREYIETFVCSILSVYDNNPFWLFLILYYKVLKGE